MAKKDFNLKPLEDRIVVKPGEEEEKTVSGIVSPSFSICVCRSLACLASFCSSWSRGANSFSSFFNARTAGAASRNRRSVLTNPILVSTLCALTDAESSPAASKKFRRFNFLPPYRIIAPKDHARYACWAGPIAQNTVPRENWNICVRSSGLALSALAMLILIGPTGENQLSPTPTE